MMSVDMSVMSNAGVSPIDLLWMDVGFAHPDDSGAHLQSKPEIPETAPSQMS
jgi:hypothetical protein